MLHSLRAWDLRAFVFINERLSRPFLNPPMELLASEHVWLLVLGAVGVWGIARWKGIARRAVFQAGASACLAFAAKSVLKAFIHRQRPYLAAAGAHLLSLAKTSSSFPSGSTTVAFAIALAAGLERRRLLLPMLLWAAGVGYGRIYVGEHYPLDAAAGALLGASAALAARFFLERLGFWRSRFYADWEEGRLRRRERALFSVLWLFAFAWEGWAVAARAVSLERASMSLETGEARLSEITRQTREVERALEAQSRELEFLQGLPNLLPKDKGYLRTQRAILSEVLSLRRQLRPRLKDKLYVVVDSRANKLYVKRGFKLLREADCSVGRGNLLVDKRTGRRWEFATPRGELRVLSKGTDPLWRKPDWAFVEAHEPIPPPDDPKRFVRGALGAYVLNLGDGYLIHGVKNEASLGRAGSHGCVRLGAEDLKYLYDSIPVGTRVYIF